MQFSKLNKNQTKKKEIVYNFTTAKTDKIFMKLLHFICCILCYLVLKVLIKNTTKFLYQKVLLDRWVCSEIGRFWEIVNKSWFAIKLYVSRPLRNFTTHRWGPQFSTSPPTTNIKNSISRFLRLKIYFGKNKFFYLQWSQKPMKSIK